MALTGPKYSMEEFARRGDAIYQRDIGPRLESTQAGHFVAIDIESGEYEVDSSEMAASDRLLARLPNAQIWMKRIGHRFTRRFGPRARRVGP